MCRPLTVPHSIVPYIRAPTLNAVNNRNERERAGSAAYNDSLAAGPANFTSRLHTEAFSSRDSSGRSTSVDPRYPVETVRYETARDVSRRYSRSLRQHELQIVLVMHMDSAIEERRELEKLSKSLIEVFPTLL